MCDAERFLNKTVGAPVNNPLSWVPQIGELLSKVGRLLPKQKFL
jgi:hypothetical protein